MNEENTKGKQTYEKMLKFIFHQGIANENKDYHHVPAEWLKKISDNLKC